MMRRAFLRYIGPALLSASLCLEVGAQAASGTIRGRVTGTIAARITAVEESTGKHYVTTTDSDGVYCLQNLPPGRYRLSYEADRWGSVAWNEVLVSPSQATVVDIRVPPPRYEAVETCNCLIDTGKEEEYVAPLNPGIALHLYAESNVAVANSPLWLTVVLTNTTKHSIDIRTEGGPTPTFGYQIYAFGPCVCHSELPSRGIGSGSDKQLTGKGSGASTVRIPSGTTLTDKIDLSKLMTLSQGTTYTIQVRRFDTSKAKNGEEMKGQPMIRSNAILVTVMASR
jgi:hypothetical protein